MKGFEKYRKMYFMPPTDCYDWARKDSADKAPIWCSVDLRDGNQALIEPMSLEEKLLYLADYMEPCRAFPEVEELRRLAYTDLDGAVGMGTSLSIQEMLQRDKELHHDTREAYECYGKGSQA